MKPCQQLALLILIKAVDKDEELFLESRPRDGFQQAIRSATVTYSVPFWWLFSCCLVCFVSVGRCS